MPDMILGDTSFSGTIVGPVGTRLMLGNATQLVGLVQMLVMCQPVI